ncbi:hypothetical protein [uncultured Nostoc sp.]|uniref:hypothetical protein n=1 Tax=uncultured Nostoc sp. TaxID=340711 RepID=UPI0035CB57B7
MDEQFWSDHKAQNDTSQEACLLNIITEYNTIMYDKLACLTFSLGGEVYIQELITSAHPQRCLEVFSIDLKIFLTLSSWLEDNIILKQSRNHFSIHQKLAIFLQIVGKRNSNWDLQETFQYLGATISLVFYEVLATLLILHKKTITLPNASEPLDSRIADDTKYFLYFENWLRALDGTHLLAHLPSVIVPLYRNRKGWLSQNVLGVCRMDLM